MRPTLAIVLFALVCAGCTTPHQPAAARARGTWVDLVRGRTLSPTELLGDLSQASVVFVGESHTNAYHHRVQLELMQALFVRGVPLMLCLEQLEAVDQPAIDRYNRREIDFATLAREIDWPRKWTNYLDYRALCEFARQHRIPVIGINAPATVIREVYRGGGIARLAAEQRAQLPPDLAIVDSDYERLLQHQLAGHTSVNSDGVRAMYEAQVARDEAMAAAILAARGSATGKPRTALVIVGAGHVAYGFGTVDSLRRRNPKIVDRTVLIDADLDAAHAPAAGSTSARTALDHGELRALNRVPADYLHLAPVQAVPRTLPAGHPPHAR